MRDQKVLCAEAVSMVQNLLSSIESCHDPEHRKILTGQLIEALEQLEVLMEYSTPNPSVPSKQNEAEDDLCFQLAG